MPDRIYTFQQRLVIQLIEGLSFLACQPDRDRRLLLEQFEAVKRLVDRDAHVHERLRPGPYFRSSRAIHPDYIPVADLLAWLMDLHEYYEALGTGVAAR